MLRIEDVSFNYYSRGPEAVAGVECDVAPGIHILLGENGAGKTTLLRLIAGMLIPDSGRITIEGEDTASRKPSVLRRLFYLPDSMEIPSRTIREYQRVTSMFYPGYSQEEFDRNLSDFGLTGDEPFARLSLGMRRKALLAYIIALRVDVLLLDEPANGLDINSKKALRSILARNVGDGQTVIISTHTIYDLRDMFDGVMVISRGHLLLSGMSWDISERLACVSGNVPTPGAIYYEQRSGRFHSILPNLEGKQTELDYSLLYGAVMSPCRERILQILNNRP